MVLCYTGILEKLRSNYVEADRALQKSLKLARQTKSFFMINENLQEIGDMYLLQGNLDGAAAAFQEGLSTARTYGFYPHEGKALFGLAQTALQQGDAAGARAHGEAALAVFARIDHVDTGEVRQWLSRLTGA